METFRNFVYLRIQKFVSFYNSLDINFRISLIGHLSLIFFVFFKGVFFPDNPILYTPTLKVDLVGLPDLLQKDIRAKKRNQLNHEIADVLKKAEVEAKKIQANHPPKELTAKPSLPKDAMGLKTVKSKAEAQAVADKNKRALERMKSLSKILDATDAENDLRKKLPVIVKGNKISPGSSLSGDAKEAASAHYYDILRERLQDNWALPAWVANQNLSAQVQIFIDARGTITNTTWVKPSGNPQFDDAIKKALQDSQPLPVPPKELQSNLLSVGILIGFPL